MKQKFAHHHLHTEYSPQDSMISIKKLVKRAKQLEYDTLTITDHGTLCGWIKFYKACKQENVKPILGIEAYYCADRHHHKLVDGARGTRHLILIAKNQTGYRNLCEISQTSYREGMFYSPRMDWDLLYNRGLGEGLIATSACVAGEIPYNIRKGNMAAAEAEALRFKNLFGKDFYIEIMDHGIEVQQEYLGKIKDLAKRLDIPVVGTNDVHYLEKDHFDAHSVLVAANTGTHIKNTNRLEFETNEYYLKTQEQMLDRFKDIPEAISNSLEIAEKCNVEIDLSGKIKLPKYDIPENVACASEYQYLRKLTLDGLNLKGLSEDKEYLDRMNYELNVIDKNGFSRYFLMVWDYINFARTSGIRVGSGRGSAVGSLVCYALGITSVDPIKYGLLFERFLNEERVSPPDIDSDFDFFRRDEVYKYIINKYGQDFTGNIGTHQSFKAKNALKAVVGATDPMNDYEYNLKHGYKKTDPNYRKESAELAKQISKFIPELLNVTIDIALEKSSELQEVRKRFPQVFEYAKHIEGLASTPTIHAAGIVVSPEPLKNIAPLHTSRDELCTQFSNEDLESLGLVKFDILALKTLSAIDMTIKTIEEKYDVKIDIENLNKDDKATLKLLEEGRTSTIFQLESPGMIRLLKDISVDRFDDIVAANALYRPGALKDGAHIRYCDGKHGRIKIDYIHDLLKPVTEETYGCLVYQEQLMKAARVLAGFTRGESDTLRKAISKKQGDLFEKLKKKFVDGCVRNNIPPQTIIKIWKVFEGYGGYGFNKSHSVAYAEMAYQTAYLKAHYPIEWMIAVLTMEAMDKKIEKIAEYWNETYNMGINTLNTCVNHSGEFYLEENGGIRAALTSISHVGPDIARMIENERKKNGKYKNFYDFCERIDNSMLTSRAIEMMVKDGALDCFRQGEQTRQWMIDNYTSIISSIKKSKSKNSQKEDMFDGFDFNPFAKPGSSTTKNVKKKEKPTTPPVDISGLFD